jgi:hypothetical protein
LKYRKQLLHLTTVAFELPPPKLPWYAVTGVSGVSVVAADEACEFFKVLPGRRPLITAGRFVAHIRLDHTVWLHSGIPRENLDLRLEDRLIFEPVRIMNLILLRRSRNETFPVGPGSVLEINPVYWEMAVIGLEAGPLTGALRRAGKVPILYGLFSDLLESTTPCRGDHDYLPLWYSPPSSSADMGTVLNCVCIWLIGRFKISARTSVLEQGDIHEGQSAR